MLPHTCLRLISIIHLNSKFSSCHALKCTHESFKKMHHPDKDMHHDLDAYQMPDKMPDQDYRTQNALIRSCTMNHRYNESVVVFHRMHCDVIRPDCLALAAVVKSSAVLLLHGFGRSLHGFAIKGGYVVIAAVAKALMDMYARFDELCDSHLQFAEMDWRDSVSWNILLSGYAHAELNVQVMNLFCLMHAQGDEDAKPNAITIAVVLPVCAKTRSLKSGQIVHAYAIRTGLESETLVGNALLSMYAKCGSVRDEAHYVFNHIGCKDVISWNSMISGYSEQGFFAEAFQIFKQMISSSFKPNHATVATILPICALVENGYHCGKEIHSYVLRSGIENDLSSNNALLTYYSKIGDMGIAESIFANMQVRDLVSWNTMITGYTMNGRPLRALGLLHELLLTGMEPDSITLLGALSACAQLHNVKEGKKIHNYVLQHPKLCPETSIGNALISFYAKCDKLDDALKTFTGMQRRDLISWNSMTTAYADNDQWEKLADLLNKMSNEGVQPDSVTILSVLQGSTFLGIEKVREVHGYSLRTGIISKLTVGNAILDAYAKCGSIESAFRIFMSLTGKNVITGNTMISGYLKHGYSDDAERVFNEMCDRDLTSWNLMVQGYAQHDFNDRAICLFREFQAKGMRPDTVSIMSILPACARLASVCLVRQCHGYKTRASFDDLQLEVALLDAYSKCGSVNDAYKLFHASPQKDLVTFTAMIGCYAMHGMAGEALMIFFDMLELNIKPDHVIFTTLLSACSHAGLVDEGWKLFRSIDTTFNIRPTMEHYACMVDLLARRGRLREAYEFIMDMPCKPNASVWGSLLGACKMHGEVEVGQLAADNLLNVEGRNIGNYVVMSNIYAAGGKWDSVEQMRKMMKAKDLKKPAGCSWIEVDSKRHVFVAADLSHPNRSSIYDILVTLDQQIKELYSSAIDGCPSF
ncbi:Tetratricopeptide-like helical domain-containing protein [Dioscorea alata]|uniref:Tetratricopeptide-like helical domain-containing protein n=1 Tax=Dioscorea alata TaxID=55571 RepID=A0ACB7W1Y8_DIOAL|nr:Tetratricopeptide-like helical domain-containing protein [Dioscorea alata]